MRTREEEKENDHRLSHAMFHKIWFMQQHAAGFKWNETIPTADVRKIHALEAKIIPLLFQVNKLMKEIAKLELADSMRGDEWES